jgi:hypothetical protein
MRHFLPGEGEPSDWFDRLNAFEQAETQRQVAFKRTHWQGLPDGGWSKRPDYTYPHILPEGEIEKAFFPPIARPAIEYCDQSNIAIHSEALNLRSSQVCCFNVIFPMRMDLELAAVALAPVLPGVRKVTAIEFEYTGPEGDGATRWLGEPPGGMRGQNRTSIDVAAWWEDEVRVASVSFGSNTSIRQDPQGAETSVENAWNKCLVGVPAMQHVDVEEIISAIKVSPRKVDSAWLDYLSQRYGL